MFYFTKIKLLNRCEAENKIKYTFYATKFKNHIEKHPIQQKANMQIVPSTGILTRGQGQIVNCPWPLPLDGPAQSAPIMEGWPDPTHVHIHALDL